MVTLKCNMVKACSADKTGYSDAGGLKKMVSETKMKTLNRHHNP